MLPIATADQRDRSPVQVCYLVDDCERAAARWAANLGAGPFFVHRGISLPDVRGGAARPIAFDHHHALGQWGPMMVELLELAPSTIASADYPHPLLHRKGLHHMTWFRPDDVDESRRLADVGWPVVATWSYDGHEQGFNDATAQLGCLVEHYPRHPDIVRWYDQIAASARGWDGRDPVRGSYLD
jgi:Glyoxalase/Bleomycin resistance protein/Dioxygenase superfamily